MRRYFNGNVILHVSREVIKNKLLSLEAMKVVTKHGKETWVSKGRTYMIDNESHEIVAQFNTEIRGFYNYYSIANNASALGRSFGCIMNDLAEPDVVGAGVGAEGQDALVLVEPFQQCRGDVFHLFCSPC